MNRSRWPSRQPATQSGGYRHGDSNPGTSPAGRLTCHRQRLDPPFLTEAEPYDIELYQNAVVLVLDDGERLVFDRADLEAALGRRAEKAA